MTNLRNYLESMDQEDLDSLYESICGTDLKGADEQLTVLGISSVGELKGEIEVLKKERATSALMKFAAKYQEENKWIPPVQPGQPSTEELESLEPFSFSKLEQQYQDSLLTYVKGDATEPEGDGMKFIVHCCNNVGGWGAGFVMALSARWDQPEEDYRQAFKKIKEQGFDYLPLGAIYVVEVEDDITVVNLIGQHSVGNNYGVPPIRYEAIQQGLKGLVPVVKLAKGSVHMPRMGAGLAGGDWDVIEKIIKETLGRAGIRTTVYDL